MFFLDVFPKLRPRKGSISGAFATLDITGEGEVGGSLGPSTQFAVLKEQANKAKTKLKTEETEPFQLVVNNELAWTN